MARKDPRKEKICNVCGDDCFVYTVWRNAIICKKCKVPDEVKSVQSEASMIENVLKGGRR